MLGLVTSAVYSWFLHLDATVVSALALHSYFLWSQQCTLKYVCCILVHILDVLRQGAFKIAGVYVTRSRDLWIEHPVDFIFVPLFIL